MLDSGEETNVLVAAIVGAEVAFWVVLMAGLAARYLLRRQRLSTVILAGVHVVNVVLLVVTVADLMRGGTADATHGLAALYLGFTVAFGHSLIRWADQRFAHRFAGGPPPVKPPKRGPERIRHEWREFGKAVLMAVIACGVLGGAILLVGDAARTAALVGWFPKLGVVIAIWLAVGPVYHTVTGNFHHNATR